MQSYAAPNWQREINSFKGIKSTIIIEGNIHDKYPVFSSDGKIKDFFPIEKTITCLYDSGDTEGCYNFLFCDPLRGFYNLLISDYTEKLINSCREAAKSSKIKLQELNEQMDNGKDGSEKSREMALAYQLGRRGQNGMIENAEIIRAAITERINDKAYEEGDTGSKSIAVVVNYASRFLASVDNLSAMETLFFLNLLYASKNAINYKKNTMIIIVDKFSDIPAWFYYNNPNVRMLTIPNPDRRIRCAYIDHVSNLLKDTPISDLNNDNRFADLTDGMKIIELQDICFLYEKDKENITDIAEAVSIFKYGFKENRWLQIRDKIGVNAKEIINRRVKGQDNAIERAVSVIKRAVLGLSGMQHSSDTKPKGILFLAGPTGTGKTELVKAITDLLFEDERSLIRFDMSEYREENSDQKLFGAPPGFVGYDQGGQLTNAVKNNPFSVLLFDEIEKAHPSIMDKFLQILEDGRMTDGRGNTVYFSETLIFFTSNIGLTDNFDPNIPYTELEARVKTALASKFKPEVRNRIGENVVVFNYIDEQASKEIIDMKIDHIISNINKALGVEIDVDENALRWFYEKCRQDETRLYGGRGIGNIIERYFLNTLSEFIFDNNCDENSKVEVIVNAGAIDFLKR